MWFFKSKKVESAPELPPALERRTKTLSWHYENFKVGAVVVEYKLEDGRKFKSVVRGDVYQCVEPGEDETSYREKYEPCVDEVVVISAIKIIQSEMCNLKSRDIAIHDDRENPWHTVYGIVKSIKVLREMEHVKSCKVARVVPISDINKKD